MMNQTHCPICENELITVFSTIDYLVSGESFDIVECIPCQLRLTHPFPDEENMGGYYESDEYISHGSDSRGFQELVYTLVRSYMLGRKRNMVGKMFGKKTGKLLDMGCGAGHFLNKMNLVGWNVSGVDPSNKARQVVKSQFNIDVASPEDWLSTNEKYDVITCWHSLEHVYEPWEYLEKFRVDLNPGGVLMVALPNYQSTDGKIYGAGWAAYDTPRHLYHFSPKSIKHIMKQNGFTLSKIHRMPFDAFYVSLLSAKHGSKSSISGGWNGLISWFNALVNIEKCSSLIYVCTLVN